MNFLFQVVLPIELAMTLLFWLFFYLSGSSLHWTDTESYVHPVFLYITPCLLMLVEGALNQVIFDYANLKWVLVIYAGYLPLTYLGKYALGYYPYPFITWTTWYSYFMIISNAALQVACFVGLAIVNNRLKRGQMERNAQAEHIAKIDQGIYNEVQMNMFKNAISEDFERLGSSVRESKRGS